MDWQEQYKHPNWQKKRLEAMERAHFCCEVCADFESQLHVHHKRYIKGRKIWEYELSELSVLCSSCHEQVHADLKVLDSVVMGIPAIFVEELVAMIVGFIEFDRNDDTQALIDGLAGRSPHSYATGILARDASKAMDTSSLLKLSGQLAGEAHDQPWQYIIDVNCVLTFSKPSES